jgi:ribosomal protein S18 acetylase RimI-like enzyme
MKIIMKEYDRYYIMELHNLLNKRIGSISFSKPKNHLIYIYTFEILKKYQNKGYGKILFKKFIDNFGDKVNMKAIILGGENNKSCYRIFNYFGFNEINRKMENCEVYREMNKNIYSLKSN